LRPKLAKADVAISTGGNAPFAALSMGRDREFALSWPTPLPKPTVDGNVARFADAAGPGADLVVTALPTGFRHDVVLRERPKGPVEFRIPVTSRGLRLSKTKAGALRLATEKGKTIASAPAPLMWDAAAEESRADVPGRLAQVAAKVEDKGEDQVLVLRPDPAWLADPATP
jgi:hypothetical protein